MLLSLTLDFFLNLTRFIVVIFLAFYIPGEIINGKILKRFHTNFERILICLGVGLVLWVYQGLLFGYLNLRFLSYLYLLVFFILWIKKHPIRKVLASLSEIKKIKINYLLLIIFLIGIFGQVQQFFITGFVFPKGIYVFTPASDDAFWHAALTNQIALRFPPNEPGLTGVVVRNYHYLSNLVTGDIVRVFKLPLMSTQFQFMYLLTSFLLGGVAYVLGKELKFNKIALILLIYFQYFSSDIIYILTFITKRSFNFTIQPLEDGTMFLENPPRAFSFVVVLLGLVFLNKWLKTKDLRTGFVTALLFGSLIGFKVHTGLPILIAMFFMGIYFLTKKDWKGVSVFFISGLVSLLVYLPVNAKAGGLVFAPFEMARMFVVQPGLGISHFELARRIYGQHLNFIQSLRMDLTMLLVFLIFQFGIRNIGFIPLKQAFNLFGKTTVIFIYLCIFSALILGTLFIQPVAHADIFNLYLTSSLFLSIFASFTLGCLLIRSSRFLKILIVISIIVLTIPRWVDKTRTFASYFSVTIPAINYSELEAMDFLKNNSSKEDLVLVFNQGQWDRMYPYVSIFTQKAMFLSGRDILGRHGISFQDRAKTIDKIMKSKNSVEIKRILEENKINILYFYGEPNLSVNISAIQAKNIFKNESINIYSLKYN